MWPTHRPSSDVAMRSHGMPHELSECGECGDLDKQRRPCCLGIDGF